MYEWDEKKSAENLSKHGLAFEDAEIVFSGRCVTLEDARYDYGEKRFITLGQLRPSGCHRSYPAMRKDAHNFHEKGE